MENDELREMSQLLPAERLALLEAKLDDMLLNKDAAIARGANGNTITMEIAAIERRIADLRSVVVESDPSLWQVQLRQRRGQYYYPG